MSVNAEYAIEEGERRPLVDQACADAIKCTEEKAPPATGTFFGSTFNIVRVCAVTAPHGPLAAYTRRMHLHYI